MTAPDLLTAPSLLDAQSLLTAQSLGVTLAGRTVLNDISLSLSSGRLVALVGPNGAGKTTLLRWIEYELEPAWIVLYLPAPTKYDTVDFVRAIFANTVREVISKRSTVLRKGRWASFTEAFREPSIDRQVVMLSERALASIGGSRSDQRSTSAGISGRGGARLCSDPCRPQGERPLLHVAARQRQRARPVQLPGPARQ